MADRKQIFRRYNAIKKSGLAESGRLNRALGIAQREVQEHIAKYRTTPHSCRCPDYFYRGQPCKGILALALTQPEPEPVEVRNPFER